MSRATFYPRGPTPGHRSPVQRPARCANPSASTSSMCALPTLRLRRRRSWQLDEGQRARRGRCIGYWPLSRSESRNQRDHPQYTKPELSGPRHHQAVGAEEMDAPLRRTDIFSRSHSALAARRRRPSLHSSTRRAIGDPLKLSTPARDPGFPASSRSRSGAARPSARRGWTRHPERFVRGVPQPDPLPQAVWINPPATTTTGDTAQ